MDSESVNISIGLPSDSSAKIAALYFDIFSRKLGAVLGRRAAVPMIADHISEDRIIVACDGEEVVGIAGLNYDGIGFFVPNHRGFLKHYGPLVGRVRAGLWASVQTNPRPHQLHLEGIGVQADLRSRGIGTALLEAVDRRTRDVGKTEVILEVVDTNPRAKALYERFGYRTVLTTRRWMFRFAGFTSADLMLRRLPVLYSF
jgi:ribosomal protein S18 acetylase RimI-like enzyme